MDFFDQLVTQYGYLAVLVGTFLEGETLLIIAAFFAHGGLLNIYGVIGMAIIGSMFGDQVWFHLGYHYGRRYLQNKPHWQPRIERIQELLRRHEILLMLGFRFVYGARIITPITLGALHVSPRKFLIFNMLGSVLWATIISMLGYAFHASLQLLLGHAVHYEQMGLLLIVVAGALVWLINWYRTRQPRT
jgi:membrane protein DedA with SNARE-associated domain